MSSTPNSDCASGSKSCTFTCPAGGTWYVCPDEPYFVGCCSSDPCSNTNSNNTSPCPNIHPASFDTAIYDSFVPNNCIDTTSDNWYTCNSTDVPFIGCCASNACAESTGCPEDDVRAAAWSSSREDQFTLFQDANPNDDNSSGDDGLGGGAIAGIVVGSVAAVVIVIALAWWFLRRRKAQRQDTLTRKSSGNQYPPSPYQGTLSFSRFSFNYIFCFCANGRRLALLQPRGNSCRHKRRIPLRFWGQQQPLVTATAIRVWASNI